MNENLSKGNIIIYTDVSGKYQVDVIMQEDTLWLTQQQLEQLFQTDRTSIVKHIKKIISDGELDKSLTCAKIAQVRKEGNRNITRNISYYNLDMILAVGYRVTSKIATHFRKWATNVLKEYITKGYSINELKLQKQQAQITDLKSAIALFERGLNNQVEDLKQAKDLSKLIADFSKGLDLLDDFDHKTLDTKGLTIKEPVKITKEEFLEVINNMKSDFKSDVFAVSKDDSFNSSINQIYQTFGGNDCYPSLEEKAAMLLYLIVKNHSFADGNKRIGASCFLYFLDKNNMLYNANNKMLIDNGTLFALTLLIAESNPKEMETIKQIIVSVLNRKL